MSLTFDLLMGTSTGRLPPAELTEREKQMARAVEYARKGVQDADENLKKWYKQQSNKPEQLKLPL